MDCGKRDALKPIGGRDIRGVPVTNDNCHCDYSKNERNCLADPLSVSFSMTKSRGLHADAALFAGIQRASRQNLQAPQTVLRTDRQSKARLSQGCSAGPHTNRLGSRQYPYSHASTGTLQDKYS